MATDVTEVLANLLRFHDFMAKLMISVEAGGGQVAGYGGVARKVIAVDPDAAALAALAKRAHALGIAERFVLLEKDFMAVTECADVVLFESSLHEMPDHGGALAHAATLAPDIVVIDQAPGSPWAHVVDETEKVVASWAAVTARGTRHTGAFDAVQRLAFYQELLEKVRRQGAESIRRIELWRGCSGITIPMAYRMALL